MTPILILHGWGSCAKNWQRVKEGLEGEGYRVFLPDLPGFGGIPQLLRPWAIDDYVEWVREYCEENNLSQIFLLGHSFGGSIATKYTLKFPKEVKKLILVDPAIIRIRSIKKEIIAKISKLVKILSFLPLYSLARRVFYKYIVKSDYFDSEGHLRATYLKVIKEDLLDHLSNISVPTVLIWGEKDKITPLKDADVIKSKISEAKLVVLPDISHNPQTEAPELLVQKVLDNL
jgi:pimeloyl-ACP methyl ester carboxylesterase